MATPLKNTLTNLVTEQGNDIQELRERAGNLTDLNTTNKTSLVAAINEVLTGSGGGSSIDDANTSTITTWSSTQISNEISAAITAGINNLVDGAPAALDTLNELAQALNDNDDFANTVLTQIAAVETSNTNKVSYAVSQSLSAAQQTVACENIGIGDPATDYLTIYRTARDS